MAGSKQRQTQRGPKSDKLWSDAVRRAVLRSDKGSKTRRLEQLADKLVALGIEGEVAAIKEIGDRIDGRPMQLQTHEGNPDNPIIQKVVVELVKSARKNS